MQIIPLYPTISLRELAPYSKMAGIYGIQRRTTGRIYVGKSLDIRSRIVEHLRLLEKGQHDNSYLQREFTKYGVVEFDCLILEGHIFLQVGITRQELGTLLYTKEVEILGRYDKTYNLMPAGKGGLLTTKTSESTRKLISEGVKAYWSNSENRKKQSEIQRKRYEDPEERKLTGEQVKAGLRKLDSEKTQLLNRKRSDNLTKFHQENPHPIISKETRDKRSESMKSSWKKRLDKENEDPKLAEKNRLKRSNACKLAYQKPGAIDRHQRSQIKANPKRIESLKRFWLDPENRKKQSERVRLSWKTRKSGVSP